MLVMMIEIKKIIIMGLKDQTSDDDNNGEGSTAGSVESHGRSQFSTSGHVRVHNLTLNW